MFERFATPILVSVIFWLGSLAIGASGVYIYNDQGYYGWFTILGVAFGILMLRVFCEWIVVQFRIYEVLVDIRDQTKRPVAPDDRVTPTFKPD